MSSRLLQAVTLRLRQIGAPDLSWQQRLRRIPLLGRILAWWHALLLLDATRRQVALGQAELHEREERLERRLAQLEALSIEERLRSLDNMNIAHRLNLLDQMNIAHRLNLLDETQIAHRLNLLDEMNIAHRLNLLDEMNIAHRLNLLDETHIAHRLNRLDSMNIDERLRQVEASQAGPRLAALDALHLGQRLNGLEAINVGYRLNRLDALDIANRLHVFDAINIANRLNRLETLQGSGDVSSAAASEESPAARLDLDAFYVDFEGEFRGERQQITDRLTVYLPYLANLADEAGARVVDVGCGRGEWLDLMAAQGIAAVGIDFNAAMVRECQQRGLAAECTDALGYLRGLPPGSLAAVTAFHLVEHLPLATLLALFDAALLALRPGGLMIIETPNPENLAVGACNFYFDPTHRHPIVPMVAEFIMRQRGFARAEILRLHPYPDDHLVHEDSAAARRLNQLLYGAQDYAVLAWKAHAN